MLFALLVQRAFAVGRQALLLDRVFSGLVAQGIGIWLGVQGFINMGVNMGLLPTKGLTLPLMSFGGSGIVANCLALAILLRVDYENRRLMRGRRREKDDPDHGRRHGRAHHAGPGGRRPHGASWAGGWSGWATGRHGGAGWCRRSGYEMAWVRFSRTARQGPDCVKLVLPFNLLRGFLLARRQIKRIEPDVVLGFGGYVTFPGGMMAALSGVPLVLHEQNSVAGLANRVLSVVADRVLTGFPGGAEERATGSAIRCGRRLPRWPARRSVTGGGRGR